MFPLYFAHRFQMNGGKEICALKSDTWVEAKLEDINPCKKQS